MHSRRFYCSMLSKFLSFQASFMHASLCKQFAPFPVCSQAPVFSFPAHSYPLQSSSFLAIASIWAYLWDHLHHYSLLFLINAVWNIGQELSLFMLQLNARQSRFEGTTRGRTLYTITILGVLQYRNTFAPGHTLVPSSPETGLWPCDANGRKLHVLICVDE